MLLTDIFNRERLIYLLCVFFKIFFKQKLFCFFLNELFYLFWLSYYLFCLFLFNRGYSMNDQLDFALTMIKRHYNINDWLKFILSFIR